MPSVPPFTAGSYAEVGRTDGGSWTFLGTFSTNVGTNAGAPPPNELSNLLEFEDWGPSPNVLPFVPSNAEDIVVRFKFQKSAAGTAVIREDVVQPLYNGSSAGLPDLANTVANWPSSSTDATYDALHFTPSQINSGLIGLRIGVVKSGGSPGDVSSVVISMPAIESITWTIPGRIATCGGSGGDEDGYGTDHGATFDDAGNTMTVGTVPGPDPAPDVQHAIFCRMRVGTEPTKRLPWNARILTATLTFVDCGGAAVPVKVCATDDPNDSGVLTDANDLWTGKIASNLSDAQIDWTVGGSSPSEPYPTVDTPDISDIVQELIRRPGYVPTGSDFLFILVPQGAAGTHDFGTSEAGEGAYLTVTWTFGGDIVEPAEGEQVIQTSTFLMFIE